MEGLEQVMRLSVNLGLQVPDITKALLLQLGIIKLNLQCNLKCRHLKGQKHSVKQRIFIFYIRVVI